MTRRIVRRRLMGTFDMTLDAPRPARRVGSGSVQIALSFAAVVIAATVLLSTEYTSTGEPGSVLEGLFTAVSAISGTGLVVFDTQAQFNFAGEVVIALVIQIGGLGYMLGVSMILWAIGGRLGLRDRQMLRLYYGIPTVQEAVRFLRLLAIYALACEVIGAVALWYGFWQSGVDGQTAIWWGIFHSISSFNEAGFNLTGQDLLPWADDPFVLVPSAILAVLGAIGALPMLLLLQTRGRRLPLDARVILGGTLLLLGIGWAFIGIGEWANELTLGGVEATDRPLLALEQSAMWATGFSAVPTAELNDHTKFFLVGMMFVGGAAGSAAAGIKIGAFLLLLATMIATFRGREQVTMLGREVPFIVVRQAMALALGLVGFIFALVVALLAVSDLPTLDVVFDAVSACANVGWTPVATAEWGTAGRSLLILGMLVGRFGPLVMVLEMTYPRAQAPYRYPEEGIRLG
jgi:trk system potassium uptake protein TrkH